MTRHDDCTLPPELLVHIAAEGLDAVPELIRVILNAAMAAERQRYLGAAPYERTETRRGYANGFKPKTVTTRVGPVTFAVPQTRDSGFYPSALEKGLRSERALTLALAEMYVQGVSTRKVAAITEELLGVELSSQQVSRAAQQLDPILESWRERPLEVTRFVYLDARYEYIRQDGHVRDAAVLIAKGIGDDGKRRILGVSVALSEHEAHWRTCLQRLVTRGLRGVELIISDDHGGLGAARKAVFGGVPWQRCQFHLHVNASAYVPRQDMRPIVAAELRGVFNAPSRADAERLLARMVETYTTTA